ncbi:hypothetical protein HN51_052294, partial [Arachis hypogaea]
IGIANAILDLVSSGTTLRENNLKEIEGGTVLESQKFQPPDDCFCICLNKLSLNLTIEFSPGCSCCKQKINDPTDRSNGNDT